MIHTHVLNRSGLSVRSPADDEDLSLYLNKKHEIINSGSSNTVTASSNDTPCFFRARFAFFGSHSNRTI